VKRETQMVSGEPSIVEVDLWLLIFICSSDLATTYHFIQHRIPALRHTPLL